MHVVVVVHATMMMMHVVVRTSHCCATYHQKCYCDQDDLFHNCFGLSEEINEWLR